MSLIEIFDIPTLRNRIAQLEKDCEALRTWKEGYLKLKPEYDAQNKKLKEVSGEALELREELVAYKKEVGKVIVELRNRIQGMQPKVDDYDNLKDRFDELQERYEQTERERQLLIERLSSAPRSNDLKLTVSADNNSEKPKLAPNEEKIVQHVEDNPDANHTMQEISKAVGFLPQVTSKYLKSIVSKGYLAEKDGLYFPKV